MCEYEKDRSQWILLVEIGRIYYIVSEELRKL